MEWFIKNEHTKTWIQWTETNAGSLQIKFDPQCSACGNFFLLLLLYFLNQNE